ncbi:MAG: hypothetical protein LW817_05070 [Candidatus Caenarcaniphilales bacterium]|jgi:hypothetical protein|nr:hypothetical protein [Candidatus Caenarcaniphilales bacterium]
MEILNEFYSNCLIINEAASKAKKQALQYSFKADELNKINDTKIDADTITNKLMHASEPSPALDAFRDLFQALDALIQVRSLHDNSYESTDNEPKDVFAPRLKSRIKELVNLTAKIIAKFDQRAQDAFKTFLQNFDTLSMQKTTTAEFEDKLCFQNILVGEKTPRSPFPFTEDLLKAKPEARVFEQKA